MVWTSGWPGARNIALHYFVTVFVFVFVIAFVFVFVFVIAFVLVFAFVFVYQRHCIVQVCPRNDWLCFEMQKESEFKCVFQIMVKMSTMDVCSFSLCCNFHHLQLFSVINYQLSISFGTQIYYSLQLNS